MQLYLAMMKLYSMELARKVKSSPKSCRLEKKKIIQIKTGDYKFYGVAAGGGEQVLCAFQKKEIKGPEDTVTLVYNTETCISPSLNYSEYTDGNSPLPIKFNLCKDFNDVNDIMMDCGNSTPDDVLSISIEVDSPNGQIRLGCFQALNGSGDFGMGLPFPH